MDIMPWRSRQTSPLSTLQSEMNRMFEDFFNQPFGIPAVRGNGHGAVVVPALDVKEDNERITVTAELPGVKREDVEISVHEGVLEIRGHKAEEHKQDEDDFHLVERSYGSFARRIRLPAEVDSERAEASMDNGVLTLALPKTGPKQDSKKIEIKAGAQSS